MQLSFYNAPTFAQENNQPTTLKFMTADFMWTTDITQQSCYMSQSTSFSPVLIFSAFSSVLKPPTPPFSFSLAYFPLNLYIFLKIKTIRRECPHSSTIKFTKLPASMPISSVAMGALSMLTCKPIPWLCNRPFLPSPLDGSTQAKPLLSPAL